MPHLAMTTLGRGFSATRGRAMAIAALGFPAAEGTLPALVVLALSAFGWRTTWAGAGGLALLILPAVFLFLLRRAPAPSSAPIDRSGEVATVLRRREVLFSTRFALLLPAMLTSGFVLTAVFFHQGTLSAAKGWPAGWFALCMPVYAAASVSATLVAGALVDRWGARRLLPLFLLPLAAASALLAISTAPGFAMLAMGSSA